jgi:phosphoglycerate-specific signal transduction histidine kinase
VQLASQAETAARGSSSNAPGSSSHDAANQRLLGCKDAGGSLATSCAKLCETISAALKTNNRNKDKGKDNNMTLILLESLLALLILIGIVWWTMKPDKKENHE